MKRAEIEAEIEAEIKEQREKAVPDLTRGEEFTRGVEEMRGPEVKDASRFHGSRRFSSRSRVSGRGHARRRRAHGTSAVAKMCEVANEVLGYDLRDVCVNGPKEKLDNTVYAQPALLLANLAALEKLRDRDPDAVSGCDACAGLSLGEYAALVFAGVLSYEDAFTVVKARAEAMSAAASCAHGMLSVVGLSDDVLRDIVCEVRSEVRATTSCARLPIFSFRKVASSPATRRARRRQAARKRRRHQGGAARRLGRVSHLSNGLCV